MGAFKRMLLAAVVVGAGSGCGDKTGPSPASLAGTWHATKAEFVSQANPAQKVELVALGGSVVLTLTESHTFTLVTTVPGEPVEQFAGSWSSSVDVLTLTGSSAGNMQFDLNLSGNTLLLTGADGEFDVNNDDVDEVVDINLTLSKS